MASGETRGSVSRRRGIEGSLRLFGIHDIQELDYVEHEGRLPLTNFLFSNATRPEHLINEPDDRPDLPNLGQ